MRLSTCLRKDQSESCQLLDNKETSEGEPKLLHSYILIELCRQTSKAFETMSSYHQLRERKSSSQIYIEILYCLLNLQLIILYIVYSGLSFKIFPYCLIKNILNYLYIYIYTQMCFTSII
jgi:hypothetical protein